MAITLKTSKIYVLVNDDGLYFSGSVFNDPRYELVFTPDISQAEKFCERNVGWGKQHGLTPQELKGRFF
jgi:hypothetical protein